MEKIKSATLTINTSDIYTIKNDFIRIKNIYHTYKVYDVATNENNELVINLRTTSIVRKLIDEAIVTCHKDNTSTVIFNRYTF